MPVTDIESLKHAVVSGSVGAVTIDTCSVLERRIGPVHRERCSEGLVCHSFRP